MSTKMCPDNVSTLLLCYTSIWKVAKKKEERKEKKDFKYAESKSKMKKIPNR